MGQIEQLPFSQVDRTIRRLGHRHCQLCWFFGSPLMTWMVVLFVMTQVTDLEFECQSLRYSKFHQKDFGWISFEKSMQLHTHILQQPKSQPRRVESGGRTNLCFIGHLPWSPVVFWIDEMGPIGCQYVYIYIYM